MKIQTYKFPESSFLSVEKDYAILMDYILKDERLKKLLYYPYKDALSRSGLTQEQTRELIEKHIKVIPRLQVEEKENNHLVIYFSQFATSPVSDEYKDCTLNFDIVCHWDNYLLDNFQLRPYKIAAEIDTIMKNIRLTGMGKASNMVANPQALDDEYSILSLSYQIVHSSEDNKQALSPQETEDIIKNFHQMFNND